MGAQSSVSDQCKSLLPRAAQLVVDHPVHYLDALPCRHVHHTHTVYMDYVKRVADTISADAPVFLFGSGRQMGLVKKRLNEGYIQMLGQAAAHVGGVRGPHTTGAPGKPPLPSQVLILFWMCISCWL
jgi:hypothetical protein